MFDYYFRSCSIFALALTLSIFAVTTTAHSFPQMDDPTDPEAQAEPEADEPIAEPAAGDAPDAPDAPISSASDSATTQQAHDLDMALHYLLIANAPLAQEFLQALFDSGITNEQIARLVDERGIREKVERAITRSRNNPDVGPAVVEFESRFLAGVRATSRNALRIEEAVASLGGSMRQEMIARTRLMAAGAFAVPALLKAMSNVNDMKLANAARSMLVDIKRLAVAPLCAALPAVDSNTQRKICEVLGEIGYPSSQAYILGLATDPTTTADVRTAALRAYARLGGTSQDAASQYTALARRYFDRIPSLIPYASDIDNVIWSYDDRNGLTGSAVPTSVYCETMAILAATQALTRDPASDMALAIYVAADLRRAAFLLQLNIEPSDDSTLAEIQSGRFSAEFFATASGARIAQMALGFAIDASDVVLVRECIRVLGYNSNAATLVTPASGRSPMIECLLFADRRVRFESAVVLARSLPQAEFRDNNLVIPALTSMLNSSGMSGAVIASTEEDRQALSSKINDAGVSSVITGASMSDVIGKLSAGQTLDLVIVQGSIASVQDAVISIRACRASATSPVVVIANGADASTLSLQFENDPRVSVFLAIATDAQFAAAIESAVGAAGGMALSPEQSQQYSADALSTLHLIVASSSSVFDIRDAERALVATLGSSDATSKAAAAGILALIPTESSQRSLMDAALAATELEQAIFLDAVAASARRLGNLLQPHQVDALKALINSSGGATADAAGRVFGALGLPTAEVVKLILSPAK